MTRTLNLKPWLLLACALLVLGVVVAVVLPPLNKHAIDRHPSGSYRAHKYVSDNGGPGDRYECKDGRVRWICALRDQDGNTKDLFAVVVIAATGLLVTCFICRHDYANGLIESGSNPLKMRHP